MPCVVEDAGIVVIGPCPVVHDGHELVRLHIVERSATDQDVIAIAAQERAREQTCDEEIAAAAASCKNILENPQHAYVGKTPARTS